MTELKNPLDILVYGCQRVEATKGEGIFRGFHLIKSLSASFRRPWCLSDFLNVRASCLEMGALVDNFGH